MPAVLGVRMINKTERAADALHHTDAGCARDNSWQERLYGLCNRFSHLGIGDGLAALSITELWGLYCFLRRLAEEE